MLKTTGKGSAVELRDWGSKRQMLEAGREVL